MNFEVSRKLQTYIDRRIQYARQWPWPTCDEQELAKIQLLHCADNGFARLKRGESHPLQWVGTALLKAGNLNHLPGELLNDRGVVSLPVEVAMKQFAKAAAQDDYAIPCSSDITSILVWWAGIEFVRFDKGTWRLAVPFYDRGNKHLTGTQSVRRKLEQRLENVPSFLIWMNNQFDKPRVCDQLRKEMSVEFFRGVKTPGFRLQQCERDGTAEPYLDRAGNLAWRAVHKRRSRR